MNMVLKAVSQIVLFNEVNHRADLNGDGWQDFYMVLWAGDRPNWNGHPNSYVYAWLNDGDGNFILSNDLFEGNPCFAGTECSSSNHNN